MLNGAGALPAPFTVSPQAMAGCFLLVLAGSAAASLLPARRAARLTVRQALAEI
jgi:putative ABC transport system permease protein